MSTIWGKSIPSTHIGCLYIGFSRKKYMKINFDILQMLLVASLLVYIQPATGQIEPESANAVAAMGCSCTIAEVEDNAVSPCNYTIGTTVTVATASEFRAAISLANSSGGNMTILIEDGSYEVATISSYPYITASNLVIRSLSGNRDAVVLYGNGMAETPENQTVNLLFAVGDNITIADLTLQETANNAIAVTGENLFVHNVKMQDTYEHFIKGNSVGGGADNGIVQCSLFQYTSASNLGPQWYIGGIDVHQGDDWVVRDNVFINIAGPDTQLAQHAVSFWNNSSNNIIERNKILNCDRGIGFGLGSSPNTGGIIRNNMIYNDGSAPNDDVGIGLESSPDTKVYNNTIIIDYPNAIEYRFSATTNVDISNNLTNQAIRSRDGGQAALTANIVNAQAAWFIDAASGDLRLYPDDSLVVDQGVTLPDVSVDIYQTVRPQSASYDIGAFEVVKSFLFNDGFEPQ